MKTHVNTVESSTKLPKSHYYIFKSNQTLFKPKFTKTNVIYFNQSLVSYIESWSDLLYMHCLDANIVLLFCFSANMDDNIFYIFGGYAVQIICTFFVVFICTMFTYRNVLLIYLTNLFYRYNKKRAYKCKNTRTNGFFGIKSFKLGWTDRQKVRWAVCLQLPEKGFPKIK